MTEITMQRTDRAPQFALTVTCPSAPGQVAALVRFLDERGCYICQRRFKSDPLWDESPK